MLLFSCSATSDSLWPHGLQHTRLPCPSLSPGACLNSCSFSWSCHPLILCHSLLLLPSVFPSIRVFPNELALQIRWPKYWSFSFSISPFNEYSGLLSFRIDLLAVQFSSVQSLSCVWLFVTPWTAACQVSLSITNSWSLLKPMSMESVTPSSWWEHYWHHLAVYGTLKNLLHLHSLKTSIL